MQLIYQPRENVSGEDRFVIETNINGSKRIQPIVAKILPVNDAPSSEDITLKYLLGLQSILLYQHEKIQKTKSKPFHPSSTLNSSASLVEDGGFKVNIHRIKVLAAQIP